MENLQKQLESLRRWKWLVLSLALLATLAAVAIAVNGSTTYSATSVAVVGSSTSQNSSSNSPEQDAVLAAAYVSIINGSAQDLLRDQAKTPEDVEIDAAPVATSPYIEITATASDPETAIEASRNFMTAFVRYTLETFARVTNERLDPLRATYQEVSRQVRARENQIASGALSGSALQDAQAALESDRALLQGIRNQLSNAATVATNPNLAADYATAQDTEVSEPSLVTNGILGLVGGLILGAAVALVLGALELRIRSVADVRDRLGLPTLGSVTRGRGRIPEARRAEDFKSLASALSVMKPRIDTVAVVSPGEGEGKTLVAGNLARYRAAQGDRVILIEADMRTDAVARGHRANGAGRAGEGDADSGARQPARHGQELGLSELLGRDGALHVRQVLTPTSQEGLWVIPAGERRSDPYALFTSERIREVIEQAAREADVVIIDTPPLLGAAESQVISASVDGAVLVVDSMATQPGAALEARDQLQRGGANILGVVLNRVSKSSAIR